MTNVRCPVAPRDRARVMAKLGRTEQAIELARNVETASLQKSKQQVLDEIVQH